MQENPYQSPEVHEGLPELASPRYGAIRIAALLILLPAEAWILRSLVRLGAMPVTLFNDAKLKSAMLALQICFAVAFPLLAIGIYTYRIAPLLWASALVFLGAGGVLLFLRYF